jgi:hypothetical protein
MISEIKTQHLLSIIVSFLLWHGREPIGLGSFCNLRVIGECATLERADFRSIDPQDQRRDGLGGKKKKQDFFLKKQDGAFFFT